jgi:hypothetical protein
MNINSVLKPKYAAWVSGSVNAKGPGQDPSRRMVP